MAPTNWWEEPVPESSYPTHWCPYCGRTYKEPEGALRCTEGCDGALKEILRIRLKKKKRKTYGKQFTFPFITRR